MDSPPSQNATLLRPLLLFFSVFLIFNIAGAIGITLSLGVYATIIGSQLLVILGGAILYRRHLAHSDIDWPSHRRLGMPPWVVAVLIVTAVVLGLLGNVLAALTVEIFPSLKEAALAYQEQTQNLLLAEGLLPQILGAISIAIVAPLCEEILFRGTILIEQRRAQTMMGAVLLNGVLFSIMHVNPMAFLSLALIGAFLAHITLSSRAIWGAIIAHSALNTANGVILPRLTTQLPEQEEPEFMQILIAFLLLAPLAAGFWWLTIRLINLAREKTEPEAT